MSKFTNRLTLWPGRGSVWRRAQCCDCQAGVSEGTRFAERSTRSSTEWVGLLWAGGALVPCLRRHPHSRPMSTYQYCNLGQIQELKPTGKMRIKFSGYQASNRLYSMIAGTAVPRSVPPRPREKKLPRNIIQPPKPRISFCCIGFTESLLHSHIRTE